MTDASLDRFSTGSGAPPPRALTAALARVGVLLVAAAAAARIAQGPAAPYVLGLYTVGCAASLWHVVALRRGGAASIGYSYALVALDFATVAATVSVTGGASSFFAFLFVVVLLEAGLLLGLRQALLFAVAATLVMAAWLNFGLVDADEAAYYNLLIQGLAFCLSAVLSGYWRQRVHRLQEFQREVLDNLNSGFLITDEAGLVLVQNRAADSILGLPAGASFGRHVGDVLRPADGGECPVVTTLRARRDFSSYELTVSLADGGRKLIGLTTSRILGRRNRLTGVIASFTDLTEMARMRQELRRQDRMAAVGELSAGLAHEIRNPLAAIRGAVEEFPESLDRPPMLERLAAIVIREADHLNRIVSDFLDFARDPMAVRRVFDVRSVVEETAALARRRDDAYGLTVAVQLPEQPVYVSGNPDQIKQVCVNLAANARDAMDGSGRLTIALSRHERLCEIRFEDDGPGIAPDDVDRIFEPFYTTRQRGIGMGLAVCMRIVTAHDGVIHAGSRPGGGACFTVRLPVGPQEEENHE